MIDNELDINVLAPNSLASEGTAGGASGDAAVEAGRSVLSVLVVVAYFIIPY